jgi:acetylornithine/succinyldiaminopimelate/putrescine aminotransferase
LQPSNTHTTWRINYAVHFLLQVARERRIPVIYDEVFTGCWRLGVPTAGALLGQAPDIACYAKLLTGGVAPLAVTLSSEEVFDAFKGPTKVGDGPRSTRSFNYAMLRHLRAVHVVNVFYSR